MPTLNLTKAEAEHLYWLLTTSEVQGDETASKIKDKLNVNLTPVDIDKEMKIREKELSNDG